MKCGIRVNSAFLILLISYDNRILQTGGWISTRTIYGFGKTPFNPQRVVVENLRFVYSSLILFSVTTIGRLCRKAAVFYATNNFLTLCFTVKSFRSAVVDSYSPYANKAEIINKKVYKPFSQNSSFRLCVLDASGELTMHLDNNKLVI
jgi:hypothetical protein